MAKKSDVRRCPVCCEIMTHMKAKKKPTYVCNTLECNVLEVVFSYVSYADMPDKKAHLRSRGLLK